MKKLRRINYRTESQVIEALLRGDTYQQIADEHDIALSTIARIAKDVRQRAPDFDELRDVATLLRKAGLTTYDVKRAVGVADQLNTINVSLQQLEGFCGIARKVASEEDVDCGEFVEASKKLLQLTKESGKDFGEIVQEFRETIAKNQQLLNNQEKLQYQIADEKAKLENTRTLRVQEEASLNQLMDTNKRTKNVGLSKIRILVPFIEDIEKKEIDVEKIVKLLRWHTKIKKSGIDPDAVGEFAANYGPLSGQVAKLRDQKTNLEINLGHLQKRRNQLLRVNRNLEFTDSIFRERVIKTKCQNCGSLIKLPCNQHDYSEMITRSQLMNVLCRQCHYPNLFDPADVVKFIGWTIISPLEKQDLEIGDEIGAESPRACVY